MIRPIDRNSAALAKIAQYRKIPTKRKRALVNLLSEQAKPIGMILIGERPENPSEMSVKIANQYRDRVMKNRKRHSSVRTTAICPAILVDKTEKLGEPVQLTVPLSEGQAPSPSRSQ